MRRVIVVLLLGACGPNYYFDKGPPPDWVTTLDTRLDRETVVAVGRTPVTPNVQNDIAAAMMDGRNRIAQTISSHVSSRMSVWSAEVAGSDQRTLIEEDVRVSSEVKIEDARVVGSFRDETTRTAYVLLSVDRNAWAHKVRERVMNALEQIRRRIKDAETSLDAARPLTAYAALSEAAQKGGEVTMDVATLDVLAPGDPSSTELRELRGRVDDAHSQITKGFIFVASVKAATEQAAREVFDGLRDFLSKHGFAVTDAPRSGSKSIRMTIRLSTRYLKSEEIANRVEHLYVSEGDLAVTEPDGHSFAQLEVTIRGDHNVERDTDQTKAQEKSLRQAAQLVLAKFRSKFRQIFHMPERQ